jgi:hypothetical integral membrane protein (TIGR02206 family)
MDMFDPNFPDRFELFTPIHIVTMILIAILWIAIPWAFRGKKDTRQDVLFRYLLAALLVAQYVGWMVWEAVTGRFTVQTSLPLNLCDISNFLVAILLVTTNYRWFEVLYFWALAGTIQSYITPNITFAFPHIEYIVFYIQHGGEILAILYLVFVTGLRPRPISMLKSYGLILMFVVLVYLFNLATGANYMFLMADTPQPSTVSKMIALFGEPPRHVLGLGLVSLASLFILYVPWFIVDLAKRKRS